MADAFIDVRTALTSTTNTTGSDARSGIGGVEVQKIIDSMIVDAINRDVEFRPYVSRKPLNQLAYIWDLRINLGSTGKAAVYSEGAGGTPYPSNKVQLFAPAISFRSDYEITGMAMEVGMINLLEDEARDALSALALLEEQMLINGDDTNVGVTSSFKGLYQLMNSYVTLGDTTSIYGIARASGKTYLDVSLEATSSTATNQLSLQNLDSAITKSMKAVKSGQKIFLCSFERADEINQLLQPQQRFQGTLNLEGGFSISTYKGIAIVPSRRMSYNGVTKVDAVVTATDTDNAMYLLNLDHIEMRIVNGIDAKHVPIMGADASQRSDVVGGYYKTYGIFVMKRFDCQVLIYNLVAP